MGFILGVNRLPRRDATWRHSNSCSRWKAGVSLPRAGRSFRTFWSSRCGPDFRSGEHDGCSSLPPERNPPGIGPRCCLRARAARHRLRALEPRSRARRRITRTCARSVRNRDRRDEATGRLRYRRRDRCEPSNAEPRHHAGEIRQRAHALRRRSALHPRWARHLLLAPRRQGRLGRGWPRRHAARATGNHTLVHAVRRPAHSRYPMVPGHDWLDATLYQLRRRSGLPASVLRAGLSWTAREHQSLGMMANEPRVYLLDVEGTVAPLSLVTDQLFPYARAHFEMFLKRHAGDAAVREDLMLLAEENHAETVAGVPRIANVARPEEVETPRFRLDVM